MLRQTVGGRGGPVGRVEVTGLRREDLGVQRPAGRADRPCVLGDQQRRGLAERCPRRLVGVCVVLQPGPVRAELLDRAEQQRAGVAAPQERAAVAQRRHGGDPARGNGGVDAAQLVPDGAAAGRAVHHAVREEERLDQVGPLVDQGLPVELGDRTEAAHGVAEDDAGLVAVLVVQPDPGVGQGQSGRRDGERGGAVQTPGPLAAQVVADVEVDERVGGRLRQLLGEHRADVPQTALSVHQRLAELVGTDPRRGHDAPAGHRQRAGHQATSPKSVTALFPPNAKPLFCTTRSRAGRAAFGTGSMPVSAGSSWP